MTPFRNSASFGKRKEFVVMDELMKLGHDVYLTLVDDLQIDCVLRFDTDPPRYIDVQIKARSRNAKHPGTFAALEIRKPRPGYFFIFYSEPAKHCWVMPSEDVARRAHRSKSGKSKGRYSITFTNTSVRGEVRPRPKWEEYKDKFVLLGNPVTQQREK